MKVEPTTEYRDRVAGIILGTAVGDALGLPRWAYVTEGHTGFDKHDEHGLVH